MKKITLIFCCLFLLAGTFSAMAAQPPKPATYILNFSSGRAAPTDESLKQIP